MKRKSDSNLAPPDFPVPDRSTALLNDYTVVSSGAQWAFNYY
jgi:hypothetical protein